MTVLRLSAGEMSVVDEASSVTEAADEMAADLLEYRVGPSVGAHTGPATAGAVYHPI